MLVICCVLCINRLTEFAMFSTAASTLTISPISCDMRTLPSCEWSRLDRDSLRISLEESAMEEMLTVISSTEAAVEDA